MGKRYYWGDLRLWREAIAHVEGDDLGENEEHHGLYRTAALHVQDSPNFSLGIDVSCLGAPNPNSKDQQGWRATYSAMRQALRARARTAFPLVWVADDAKLAAIETTDQNALTVVGGAAANPFTAGDVALIRRAGAGNWSLVTVGAPSGMGEGFALSAVAGTTKHTLAAGDEVILVEGYWLPMFYKGLAPSPFSGKGDWFAKELAYRFRGSGTYVYARTSTSTVGS